MVITMKTRVVLLNTSILTTFGRFTYWPITLAYAQELSRLACGGVVDEPLPTCSSSDPPPTLPNPLGPLLSAVGHESTAQVLSSLLGVPVPVNRIQYVQQASDLAIVFKLRGRPPEGRVLTVQEIEGIGYDFGMIRMESST
jgi:hypothetical protein